MYHDYFTEYVHEAKIAMYRYLLENEDLDAEEVIIDGEEEEDGKPGVYKVNYYFRDHLQVPKVTPVLAKKKNRDAIIQFTGQFIADHTAQLVTSGPIYNFTFADKETSVLYELFNTNKQELIDMFYAMVKETYYGKISKFIEGWVVNAPHKNLLTCILIDALQNGYDDIVECCEYLWAFAEYPMHYRVFWKLGVDEQTMNYTIEHLGSKFKVKKVNNLLGLLKYDGHSSVEFHAERLMTGADHTYVDFMRRMSNQIKNTLKNISKAYYDNIKNNATQHNRDVQFDDGTSADMEGYTTNMAQVVDATINKFSTGGINNALARASADGAQVDKDNLVNFINMIMNTKNNKLYKFVEDVITAYFQINPASNSVGTTEFVSFGLKLFRSISTSKDSIYREIRQILDYWMEEIINIRQYYQREGTISCYTRGIYNYFIFLINYYN